MFSRFLTNLIMLLLAGFVVVACFAFGLGTVVWLAFGVACAVAVLALVDFALPARGGVQRTVDLLAGLLAAWLIVASREFDGGTARWLAFGAAASLAGLAVIGLITHELRTPRAATEYQTHNGNRVRAGEFQPYATTGPHRQAAA